MIKKFIVSDNFNEKRLDIFLSYVLMETRSQIIKLIEKKYVQIDKNLCLKNGVKLKTNQLIEIELPVPDSTGINNEKININDDPKFNIDIIHEDEHILVINKPINLIVHGAPSVKELTLVDWLKHKNISLSTISAQIRHGIVHRLDKGTSGAMIIAKTNSAHVKLSSQLQDKSMGRYYLAIIDKALKENTTINKPLGRNPNNRIKMSVIRNGKEAKSAFCKISIQKNNNYELILVKLFTGRTHQIRAHLNYINRHILGDKLYDFKDKLDKISRIYLHAYYIYFIHPHTNKQMILKADIPNDFKNFVKDNNFIGDALENINQKFIDDAFSFCI